MKSKVAELISMRQVIMFSVSFLRVCMYICIKDTYVHGHIHGPAIARLVPQPLTLIT